MWRIFSSLCLTWGHLYKGGLDYRRIKTKRLTRLSVYVERKNVCKWSLFCLHVGKLLWSFFFTQFFSNTVESVLFYSGMVTREVKSRKWDFQDGATGRNSIVFRIVLCMWRKRPEKEGELKGLHYSRRSHLVQDPPLGKGKEIPRSFFIIRSPEMFYFRLKSFHFIKWLNNDVIIIENRVLANSYSWSLVPRGHSSWSLVCSFRYIRVQHFHEQTAFVSVIFKTLGLIRLTRILSHTNQAQRQQIPKLLRVQTAWQYNSQKGPDHTSQAGPVCQAA